MSARILSYSIKNYGSVDTEQTIDFSKTGNIVGLYGENACGKTTIINALALHLDLAKGLRLNFLNDKFLTRKTFFYNEKNTESTIRFVSNKTEYIHKIIYDKNKKIIEEIFESNNVVLFSYNLQKITFSGNQDEEIEPFTKKIKEIADSGLQSLILPLYSALLPKLKIPNLIFYCNGQDKTKFHPTEDYVKELNKYIPLIDVNISKITYDKERNEIFFHHTNDNKETMKLPIYEESKGIQNLTDDMVFIISSLKKGGIVIFDEIENSFHPKLLQFIISTFQNKKYNKNNAYLIFTSHSIDTFDYLKQKGIIIVDKINHQSILRPLYETEKSSRSQTKKNFLNGSYGSSPCIQSESFLYYLHNNEK